nr:acyl-CoA carboxylase subunit epsilon [Kribbella solani]
MAARAGTPGPSPDPQRANNWATYWRNARQPLHPGPGQWRASAHP